MEKYLKYKKKYLNLKNQIGGVACLPHGFIQHHGECWHDSLLTSLLLSNEFGEHIQFIFNSKTIDEIINEEKPKEFLLPLNINYDALDDFKKYSKIYLEKVDKRLKQKSEQGTSKYEFITEKFPETLELKKQESEINSICSSNTLLDIRNINNIDKVNHGGDDIAYIITVQLYNYYFYQSGNEFINLEEINNIDDTITIDHEILKKTNSVLISINSTIGTDSSHAVCFYKCNTQESGKLETNYFYYDDNLGDEGSEKVNHLFDWNEFLLNKQNKFSNLFNKIKDMSYYFKEDSYKLEKWKITKIRLLYYDEYSLIDECISSGYSITDTYTKISNEYYIKIYKLIRIWFCNDLLISNRITQFDKIVKQIIFPEINSNKNLYDKILTKIDNKLFNTNFLFYTNDELSNNRNNKEIMLKYINENPLYICYLSKTIDINADILFIVDKNVTNIYFINLLMNNPTFILYKNIICINKELMCKLINVNIKYVKFLPDQLKYDFDVIKITIDHFQNSGIYKQMFDYIDEYQLLILVDNDFKYFSNMDIINKDKYAKYLDILLTNPKYNLHCDLESGKFSGISFFLDIIYEFNWKIKDSYYRDNITKYFSIKFLDIIKNKIIPYIIKHETCENITIATEFCDQYGKLSEKIKKENERYARD
jgi:hypothetical protein